MPNIENVKRQLGIIGNSPALNAAIERAVKVAPYDLSVLVYGESGSGKEFFPKIIHQNGPRKHKRYIAVNCGAIPEGTIDSELFGHEKGSFTGAISDRKGYFEEANGGTIFLDEVAELPMTTQARLLRVLETGEFLKVGSSKVQKTDIRVVAATNVDLQKAVAQGRFREDLYYRLSTIGIQVPALHDRGDDVLLLARKFAADFAERFHTRAITFEEDARRFMLVYRWPGNVRQLKNVVEQLAIFEAGNAIDRRMMMDLLPIDSGASTQLVAPEQRVDYAAERELLWQTVLAMRNEIDKLRDRLHAVPERPLEARAVEVGDEMAAPLTTAITKYELESKPSAPQSLDELEREKIADALNRHGGRRREAAEELKISERTIYRKIKEYGLE